MLKSSSAAPDRIGPVVERLDALRDPLRQVVLREAVGGRFRGSGTGEALPRQSPEVPIEFGAGRVPPCISGVREGPWLPLGASAPSETLSGVAVATRKPTRW